MSGKIDISNSTDTRIINYCIYKIVFYFSLEYNCLTQIPNQRQKTV